MSDVPAAVGFDRLPWLADDHQPRPARNERRVREWLGWTVAALLAIAGLSYWLGVRTADAPPERDPQSLRPPVTVPIPAPREAAEAAPPQVALESAPHVAPVAPPPVKAEAAPQSRSIEARAARQKVARPARAAPAKAAPPALWPVRVEAGASGRLVRIGTFATRQQARRGWSRIMRFYPGMSRFPALVVPQRSLRDRRTYYRLQMGTTSQAHSEVLCQRMRMIGQSCVVVDLPAGARR